MKENRTNIPSNMKYISFIKKNYAMFIFLIIFLVVLFAVIFFIGSSPMQNQITENKPITKFLCNMWPKCESKMGKQICSLDDKSKINERLLKSKEYNGCNTSSRGFEIDTNEDAESLYYITLESCYCRGEG